jgi:hypothetical protein
MEIFLQEKETFFCYSTFMKNTWNFEDILDFSYFFRLDSEREENTELKLHQRDRQFFLDAQQTDDNPPPTPQYCQKLWLTKRRSKELGNQDSFLPGDIIRETHTLFRFLLLTAGFIIGCCLALSYFVYTGKVPLNVFQYLTLFIIPQLLLIFLLIIKAAFSPKKTQHSSSLHQLLHSLFSRFFFIIKKRLIKRLSPQKQSTVSAIVTKEQGSLSFWPFFLASQLFGLGFNCGIFVVTTLKIVTTDLAFGWQSTLQLGPENLFAMVKIIALPWSWLLSPEFSHPSLFEIEGSRIILKDGDANLLTQDLTSWWPFLLLCLTCYGLLPRVFLFFFGCFMEQHTFKRYLQQNKFEILTKRMLTPLVSTQAPVENTVPEDKLITPSIEKRHPVLLENGQKTVLVLIPDDIYGDCTITALKELLQPYNYVAAERRRVFESYDADNTLISDMAQMSWNDLQGIVVFMEAWMVPIEEQVGFLHNIAESIPTEIEITIYFLGRPTSNTAFPSPLRKDVEMWKTKISSLLDRIICLEPLNKEIRKQ